MTKMSIVTDQSGKLIAAVTGHDFVSKPGEWQAEVSFAPGHKVHKTEVDDDITKITDATVFQDRISKYIPKS